MPVHYDLVSLDVGATAPSPSASTLDAGSQLMRRVEELENCTRIACELHDVVVQRLFGAGLHLESLRRSLQGPVATQLAALTADLDATIDEIQATIRSLHTLAGYQLSGLAPVAPRPAG